MKLRGKVIGDGQFLSTTDVAYSVEKDSISLVEGTEGELMAFLALNSFSVVGLKPLYKGPEVGDGDVIVFERFLQGFGSDRSKLLGVEADYIPESSRQHSTDSLGRYQDGREQYRFED